MVAKCMVHMHLFPVSVVTEAFVIETLNYIHMYLCNVHIHMSYCCTVTLVSDV